MAYIKVDHSEFEKTAATIDSYISQRKQKMESINRSVVNLNSAWNGPDYEQIKNQWLDIDSKNSTSDKLIKTLENYADALRYTGNSYFDAQSRAIDRANALCY
ncbi:MAG: hypothetical protein IKU23_03405 [Clostridia bacterium]|nr:hypothetical protein [Clostridia bacterium]